MKCHICGTDNSVQSCDHYNVVKNTPTLTPELEQLRDFNQQFAGTNYWKVLIEGNTGIYLAHPSHRHHDYNKSRVMDKTSENLVLMAEFNKQIGYEHN